MPSNQSSYSMKDGRPKSRISNNHIIQFNNAHIYLKGRHHLMLVFRRQKVTKRDRGAIETMYQIGYVDSMLWVCEKKVKLRTCNEDFPVDPSGSMWDTVVAYFSTVVKRRI